MGRRRGRGGRSRGSQTVVVGEARLGSRGCQSRLSSAVFAWTTACALREMENEAFERISQRHGTVLGPENQESEDTHSILSIVCSNAGSFAAQFVAHAI